MKHFATFDPQGLVSEIYCDMDAAPIPAGAVEIGPEDFARLVTAPQGWRWADGALVARDVPARPRPLPDLSDRQFARGLWGDGVITYADFLGFIGPGSIPGPIQVIVNTLADDDTGAPTPRKEAVGFLTGAKSYAFAHPLVEVFRQAMAAADPRWTSDYLRARWAVWATL